MPASFLLTLSTAQLDIVRDALLTVGHHGCGRFEAAQEWWGNKGDHGDYGTMLQERLTKISGIAQKLGARGIHQAPERARMAWDIAAAIRLAQASRRLKKSADYASMPRVAQGPPAKVDCIRTGTRTFMAPLESLREVPLPPTRKKPVAPVVPALFPARAPKKTKKKHTALIKKKPVVLKKKKARKS